ncbi:hypothetical protein SPOG_01072 [Schizosaccharomyces cryophilus OY26]|uniref:Uncharacterized protein n=1 Tax=Schizosaccharomyces cryophilus (strain OY26 / ATCC MYA-4695 / CBS 11777 / NBRC 106824 / NRRL Y48691) TaxID=653667 RepID=S9X909_SCHCR|nr:uncharacterized protein SPOG_01072 [Schizosaccharomyces cryophilus OY26]EPY50311.1 hypothetical protein SPOG_01072 [Schizosaccharomyces cryophilus OY26]
MEFKGSINEQIIEKVLCSLSRWNIENEKRIRKERKKHIMSCKQEVLNMVDEASKRIKKMQYKERKEIAIHNKDMEK